MEDFDYRSILVDSGIIVQCSGGNKFVSFELFRPQNVCNFELIFLNIWEPLPHGYKVSFDLCPHQSVCNCELTFLNMGETPPWLQLCIFWPLSASECLQSAVNRNFTSAHEGFHAEGSIVFFVFSDLLLRRIFALLSLCMYVCPSVTVMTS